MEEVPKMLAGVLALTAAAAVAALILFRVIVTAAVRDRARRTADSHARLEKELRELRRSIEALHRSARSSQPEPDPPVRVDVRGGMNRTRRAEALRLARMGESASHISALLGVPRAEIDLLLKVRALERKAPTS